MCTLLSTVLKCRMVGNGCGGNVTCTAMENLIFLGHCLIQENTDWYAHELVQGICTARQQYRYMKFINFRNTGCTRKYFLHLTYSVHDVTCSGTGNSIFFPVGGYLFASS